MLLLGLQSILLSTVESGCYRRFDPSKKHVSYLGVALSEDLRLINSFIRSLAYSPICMYCTTGVVIVPRSLNIRVAGTLPGIGPAC